MRNLYTVVLGEMAFHCDNIYIQQQGEAYILTRQMCTVLHAYQNLGLVLPGGVNT